jgi:Protein of unknown function (DUF3352)
LSHSRTRTLHPRRRALAPLVTAIALGALAGCGSSTSGTAVSPATAVPASAPLYIDAVVQPSGSLKSDATAAGRTLTQRSDPFTGLLQLLQGPTGKAPDYAKEVKPWLGVNAGLFLDSVDVKGSQGLLREALNKALAEGLNGAEAALLGSGGLTGLLGQRALQGALVLDTTDAGKARSFLETQAHSVDAHSASYRGIAYQVAPDGIAEGIVHSFAVIGSEAGIKSVIDTELGAPSLAQAPAYTKLASTAESGRLANVYLSPEQLTASVKAPGGDEAVLQLLQGLLGNAGQIYISLIPSPSSIALDVDTLPPATANESQPATSGSGSSSEGSGSPSSGSSTSGAQVLRGLPGNAWLAIGVGDLDKTFGNSLQGLHALASLVSGINIDSFSLEKVFAPLSSPTIDVRRDLLSWMGATGVFVSGSSILSLQAAVVIDSKDRALSSAAIPALSRAYRAAGGEVSPTSIPGAEAAVSIKLPNFPAALTLADGQGKFVFGLGAASAQEAFKPQSTLAGSATYNAAAATLGQGIQPSALVDFRTLLGIVESLSGEASGLSGIASALQPLDALAVGGGESLSNGVKRSRVVLGLQQPAG